MRTDYAIPINTRPTDMLEHQLAANRLAARPRRNNAVDTVKYGFAHDPTYRRFFVLEMLDIREELQRRRRS